MKDKIKRGCIALSAAFALTLFASCAPPLPKEDHGLSFRETEEGSVLCFGDGFESSEGALGIRVAYDTVDGVSEIYRAHYSSVVEQEGGYLAMARVATAGGSRVAATDFIVDQGGKITVQRTLSVEAVGAGDLGFVSYFPLVQKEVKKAEEYRWFCPSDYYGNDGYTFSGIGVKTGFTGELSVVAADNAGAPLLTAYDEGSAITLLDKTAGFRETVGEDHGVNENKILIDERLNLPGVGIANVEKEEGVHAEIFHVYPSFSYNYITVRPFNTQYRMLPMEEGLSREISFDLMHEEETDFPTAIKTAWREAYDHYAVTDRRYAAADVKDVLIQAVDRSYAIVGGVPQYMTNTDHYLPDSGFLYRNADLAMLMLSEGRRMENEGYVERALSVIDSQVARGALDENLSSSDPLYASRVASDALTSLLRAYENELRYGIEHSQWLNYLLQRANVCLGDESWLDAAFLTELARVTGGKIFLEKSVSLMEGVADEHQNFRYFGAITNPAGDQIIDRESGIIALGIYLNLYELTKEERWLSLAEHSALFVESWHQIQPILLEPFDCSGTEKNWLDGSPTLQGYLGNGKIMPYGLSYISGQTTSADISGVLAAPDFYRLYQLTNDEHYLNFYEYITYNSTLYVNMGDKVGWMDDILHNTGKGFINEYIGIASGGDYAVPRRGSMHDSNIAWLPYAILQNYERISLLTDGEGIVVGDDTHRDFNLAKHKYAQEQDGEYVYDLNEYCDISAVNGAERAAFSMDGKTWFEKGEGAVRARYVKTDTPFAEILGIPYTYDLLSADATVSTAGGQDPQFAVDAHNYGTVYTAPQGSTLLLDFGEAKDVYQIAVKFGVTGKYCFTVETSADGVTFVPYAAFDCERSVYTFTDFAGGVRYVKLTLITGVYKNLQDFKVLGAG